MTDYPWYDAMGRVLQSEQSFGGNAPYIFSYSYNDAGLKTMHYPSGRTLTYRYDAGARVISVSGQMGAVTSPYVSNANYTAWGAMEDLTLASGHWVRIPAKAEGTRTAFRAEGEQFSERSDAGNSIVPAFVFVKKNLSRAQRRFAPMVIAEAEIVDQFSNEIGDRFPENLQTPSVMSDKCVHKVFGSFRGSDRR